MAELIVLVVGASIMSILAPIRTIAFILGLLLPIDAVGAIDPLLFDLVRYVLAAAVVFRAPRGILLHRSIGLAMALLCAAALVMTISGLSSRHGGMTIQGITAFISIFLAVAIGRRNTLHRAIIAGLLFGITWSGIDIILQWQGLPFLGAESEWGNSYSGFSENRTHAAPFLAMGALIYLSRYFVPAVTQGSSWWWRAPGAAVCLTGLILTAGRGGMLALVVGGAVWAIREMRGRPLAAVLAAAAGFVLLYRFRDSFLFTRLEVATTSSSGRIDRNVAAWEAFASSPFFGPAPASDMAVNGANAHTPVLSFAVDAGVIGLLAAVVASAVLIGGSIVGAIRWRAGSEFAVLMCVVMSVTIFLEPYGYFVGIGKTIPLLVALQQVLGRPRDQIDMPIVPTLPAKLV